MSVSVIPAGVGGNVTVGVRVVGVSRLLWRKKVLRGSVAAGAGSHPTFVFFHGLPGNEKNLDLAQAVRRAGWNAITVNYRGSWGSPGQFRFDGNLEDAVAVLAFLRDPLTARTLGIIRQAIFAIVSKIFTPTRSGRRTAAC